MKHRVWLSGKTKAFTEDFKRTLCDCGYDAALRTGTSVPREKSVVVYEVRSKKDIQSLMGAKASGAPFLAYTDMVLSNEIMSGLREAGLVGLITSATSPEVMVLHLNKALFYDMMRRKNPRVPVSIPINLSHDGKEYATFASLLSKDGMFIVTLNPLPSGTICDLAFKLPRRKKVFRSKIKVLYTITVNKELSIIANSSDPFKRLVTHPGMAVFFEDMGQEERDSINAYIKEKHL